MFAIHRDVVKRNDAPCVIWEGCGWPDEEVAPEFFIVLVAEGALLDALSDGAAPQDAGAKVKQLSHR